MCYYRLWCAVLGCWLSEVSIGQQAMRPGRGMLHDACSTCFGHFYAHHQELENICVLLPPVMNDRGRGTLCFIFGNFEFCVVNNVSSSLHYFDD